MTFKAKTDMTLFEREVAKFKRGHVDDPSVCGELATLHPMFEEWQPAGWMQGALKANGLQQWERWHKKFVDFYLDKPHILRYKTDWNKAFFEHCKKNKAWLVENQMKRELKRVQRNQERKPIGVRGQADE